MKKKYPHIQRVFVRAQYPYISKEYEEWLLTFYEKTYFPPRAINAGKAVYIERNYEMIDNADICVIYFNDKYLPKMRKHSKKDLSEYQPKSGTGIAYKYAVKKKRIIINLTEKI